MYYLINTMSRVEANHVGRVISRHRTIETALKAQAKLARSVREANGQNSYLPTTILKDGEVAIDHADAWRVDGATITTGDEISMAQYGHL